MGKLHAPAAPDSAALRPMPRIGWLLWMHRVEGVAMLATGPFLMLFGGWTLDLWGVAAVAGGAGDARAVAALCVAMFGALVFLMGWIEARVWGRLSRECVEAWFVADLLFLMAFVPLIHGYGVWNFWSIWGTAFWPLSYAPARLYWLTR